MRKEITETVTRVISICDHKDCEEDISGICVQKECNACGHIYCDDHIFVYGSMRDDCEQLCQYCIDIYDEILAPLKLEIYNLRNEKIALTNKIYKVKDKIREIGENNYSDQMRDEIDYDNK